VTASRQLRASYWLGQDPVEAGYTRQQVRKTLPGWGLGAHTDLAVLIASELVTNAQLYGAGRIELRLSRTRDQLWIEVSDGGSGRPLASTLDADAERGRGLRLIDGLLALHGGRWGVTERRAAKTVFVVIPLRGR
jgi:two-component sensor histidine kinase